MTETATTAVEIAVESPLGADALRRALATLAEETAFRLETLSAAAGRVKARFALRASGCTAGDGQIYDLLRRVGTVGRWVDLSKLDTRLHAA